MNRSRVHLSRQGTVLETPLMEAAFRLKHPQNPVLTQVRIFYFLVRIEGENEPKTRIFPDLCPYYLCGQPDNYLIVNNKKQLGGNPRAVPYQNTLKNYSFTTTTTTTAPKNSVVKQIYEKIFKLSYLSSKRWLQLLYIIASALFLGDARNYAGFAHLQREQIDTGGRTGKGQRQRIGARPHSHGLGAYNPA